jgi:hypothetical protein
VTELLQYLVEPTDLLHEEAEALLAGIVLDTKHFTMRTGGRTFEAAAFLRRAGADTADVQRMFQNDLGEMISRYDIIRRAQVVHGSIAVVTVEEDGVDRVAAAQAADELLTLKGMKASFVVFRAGQGRADVRPLPGGHQRPGDPGGPGRRRQLHHRRRSGGKRRPRRRPGAAAGRHRRLSGEINGPARAGRKIKE